MYEIHIGFEEGEAEPTQTHSTLASQMNSSLTVFVNDKWVV